jgi:putative heme-binding domain-containing protein
MPSPRLAVGVAALLLLVITRFAVGLVCALGEPSEHPKVGPAKLARPAWTTSRVVGSPDPPPPFRVVRAFPNLKFAHPLLMARCPGSDRLFVGEQAGVLYSFTDRPDAKAELFFDLRKEIKTIQLLPGAKEVEAVYGLAFHPNFEQNRQCFVCYTLVPEKRQQNFKDGTRVSRFKVRKSQPPRIDAESEEIVLTFLQGGHNGGDIHFGPDGMLYISTGDAANPNPPDALNTGQDISDLLSSILRIDVDHKTGQPDGKPGEPGSVSRRRIAHRNYAVPQDNPFVDLKGAAPEVWAYGFRNPWRMAFDRQTGELFVGDVGWELWESVHRVVKGGNYGWSAMEGPQPIRPGNIGPTPIRPPLIELPHTIACSVTGGRVYRGRKFPELRGAYVFGDWETRRLWAARFDGDRTTQMPEIARPSVRIVAFGENKEGELYFLDYDGGTLHTIERNDAGAKNSTFPTRLSDTGLFASVKDQTPAAGVIPFLVNSRQWQDGATAQHWAAFPGVSSAILYPNGGKPIPGMVDWHNFRMHFPKDAVLARTVALSGRRLETQLLHFDGVDWHPYTFAWRADQADADLVPAEGAEKVVDAPPPLPSSPRKGERGKRVWQFHSRGQCLSCHSSWSEYALAFQTEQLNRPGADGRNQLIALTEAGFIRRASEGGKSLPPFDSCSAARDRKLADPSDLTQPVEARARAYLHANCGHCHCEHGGGTVDLRLQFPVGAADMKAVGLRPTRGDFGLPDACIVKPGDPYASTLYFRMAKFGRDRMPHIGSDQPDEAGLKLMETWIAGMRVGTKADPPLARQPLEKLLSNSKSALLLARKLGRGEMNPAERNQVLTAAAKLQAGPIRDLFEGYLPSDPKGARKLGSNPRPGIILALKGDSGRGERLFWSPALNCGSCHKIGERGTPVGPELSAIGRLRARENLLESILEPSRRIEPKYAVYVVHTADGRSFSGLLLRRDEKAVVLRNAQNQEIIVAAKNVEQLHVSRTSLMPDGQVAGLTASEAADLLAFLASRK